MQDIPKTYTALAEWLSCVTILIAYRNLINKNEISKIVCKLAAALPVLYVIQMLCGMVSNVLWLFGMFAAIFTMIFLNRSCLGIDIKASAYLSARGFLKAEFLAAIEWQIYYYYFIDNIGEKIFSFFFCVFFYLFGYLLITALERKIMPGYTEKRWLSITKKQLALEWGITLLIFMLSNMSYVSFNNPFTGTGTMEIFNIRTLFSMVGVLLLEALQMQKLDADRRQEVTALNNILQNQYNQYRMSQESRRLIDLKYHDLKHHLQILREESNGEKRGEYLDEIEQGIKKYEAENKTGNSVLDTILTNKSEKCINMGISLITVADGTLLNQIHVMDICTIFGNALDNAIEYEAQVTTAEKRLIHVTVSQKNNFICVVIENYFEGELEFDGHFPSTTKADKRYHGYGLKSICYAVEKYEGYMNVEVTDNWFRLEILFPKA
ncbi:MULTISPECIES: ATP-binding protein [Hungatella]|uniref:GHKL domain-containing protein n=1 Tax=Hungatella hathewayi TaxID=154046 RepID=A0AAW9WNS8_9FIRM|nr:MULTISPECIES: sensor histidine kinase [Hungatella]MCQ4830344.1 GHKL domain-containing protein [Hungatella sp. SL.1.14]MUB66461.1 GHKL domain-containing protein [Hungatella hathewayi]CUQ52397.1 sensor histidine kinase VirS [Hungatella hathewayi]